MSRPAVGTIVVVDWRGGALPEEPNRLRPAIVVEDDELFPDRYPNTIVEPLTTDPGLAHRSFAVRIEPDRHNGVKTTCWALPHHITNVSLHRVEPTPSHITGHQLAEVRSRIALATGGS